MIINVNLFSIIETIVIWIGIWGVIDNIINKYVEYENYDLRIILYSIIIIIGFVIYYLIQTYYQQ